MFVYTTHLKYKLPDGNWWFGHFSIEATNMQELPTRETIIKGNFWFSKDKEGWQGEFTLDNENILTTCPYIITDAIYNEDISSTNKFYTMPTKTHYTTLPKQTARIEDCTYETTVN